MARGDHCAGSDVALRKARESLWLDELHTSWVVAGRLSDVAWRAAAGNQSPLYFYLLWGEVQVLGQHEWTLRLPSLLAGIALIGVVAQVVGRWTGVVAAGLLAALLVAINRDFIFFAQEARPYALVQLSALVHGVIFIKLLYHPSVRWRIAFVLGAAGLFYLHYTAFLFLVAEALCLLILLPCRRFHIQYSLPQALQDAAVTALLLMPAAAPVASIAQQRDNWTRIVQAWPPPRALQMAAGIYLLVPASVLAISRLARRRSARFTLLGPIGIFATLWCCAPPLVAWFTTIGHIAPLFLTRYVVASLVGAVVFAALAFAALSGKWWRCGVAVITIGATLLTSGMLEQWARDGRIIGDRAETWNVAVPWLNDQLQQRQWPVFLCPGLLEDLALQRRADRSLEEYCLFPVTGIYRLHAVHLTPLPTSPNVTLTATQCRLVAQQRGAWLVLRAGPLTTTDIVRALQHSLRQQGIVARVTRQKRFGGIAVMSLRVE